MNFCFDFLQELLMVWEAISNIRKGVSSDIQTPWSWLKKTRLRLVFSTTSRCLDIGWNTLPHVWYITSNLEVKGLSYKEDLIKKPNLLDHINHLHLLQIFLSFAFLELLLGLLKWLPLNIFSLISISTFPKSTLQKKVKIQFLNCSEKELFWSPLQNFLRIAWHESF